jgi:hypothetical protein
VGRSLNVRSGIDGGVRGNAVSSPTVSEATFGSILARALMTRMTKPMAAPIRRTARKKLPIACFVSDLIHGLLSGGGY